MWAQSARSHNSPKMSANADLVRDNSLNKQNSEKETFGVVQ